MTRRVFVVGCPRSGTTYLQSLLAAHPAVVSFPETHFFRAVGNRLRTRLGLASIRGREREALVRFLQAIERPDLQHLMPQAAWRVRPYVAAFRRILDTLAEENEAGCWVEKTPDHLHYVDQIRRFLPDALFVHVVRNGEDTVASLYDVVSRYPAAWDGPYDLDWCIDRWQADVARTAACVSRPGHFWVRYEALAARPGAIQSLFTRLNLPAVAPTEAERQAAASTLLRPGEPWKQPVRHATAPGRKFERVFSPEQRQYVRARLRPIPAILRMEAA